MYMPSATHPISQFVAYCLDQCLRGFDNPFHWRNWLRKWRAQIDLLNAKDRAKILAAHENATWNEGTRSARSAP